MRRRLRFDIWLCGLLSLLVASCVGYIARQFSHITYDDYTKTRIVEAGEVGGVAGEDIPRAMNIDDLLDYDLFTITSEGLSYMNEGLGYYGDMGLYNVKLPSGERVAVHINTDSIQRDSLGSSHTILPVGKIVYADLTQSENFLEQIEIGYALSRYDFYVDMKGEGGTVSKENRGSFFAEAAQAAAFIISFPIFHALGSRIGVFPYFFPPRQEREN